MIYFNIILEADDCILADIDRGSNGKKITIKHGYTCPTFIDKSKMVGDSSGDTFEVDQNGAEVIVNRIGSTNWGMILMFKCCKVKGKNYNLL